MVLVNGAEGIGTGWSTYVPNFNPKEIVENLKRLLRGEAPEPMAPWYRGFRGDVAEVPSKTAGKSYNISGTASQSGDHTIEITELPVRKWTQASGQLLDYKEFLEALLKGDGSKGPKDDDKKAAKGASAGGEPLLLDYKEHHTDTTVHFSCDVVPAKMPDLMAAGLEAKLKLSSKISTGNMMLFDAEGKIRRYESPEEILTEFFGMRLQYYERRRVALLQGLQPAPAWPCFSCLCSTVP
ncbi:DNA topoisomerase II [Monoraphidium neglectum]|uniref:DNA topoisomerase (ATP-hydrolyzing) n=1 Tax=Monoraphidium neglectum TaxID=145388 RepID=A0A0D2KCR1_9CHLO|nr:DNA topoisomerase II [Monoraphidium neglectum]KIY93608.1 DNA topoisomerase II [Monoraphidium neglectum]|eukprot:XP_013892628.1 DNA topoisomerase II [Monoraphidium neglectum]